MQPSNFLTAWARRIGVVAIVVTLLGGMFLYHGYSEHAWLINDKGQVIANDFVNVWAAGTLANEGKPALAYDWEIHRQTEYQTLGYDFGGYFGWHYPPPFLFMAKVLASFPYLQAWVLWGSLTLLLYCGVIYRIVGHWSGIFIATAFPATMWNLSVGQNGFLSAALVGATLLLLEKRPNASGIVLGLLSYKPHFGLSFPLPLLVEKRWGVIFASILSISVLVMASCYEFGATIWTVFFQSLPKITTAALQNGEAHFFKLQSVFGLVRWLGGGLNMAYCIHGAVAGVVILSTVIIRKKPLPNELKSASLGLAVMTTTPYLYIYDFTLLLVPLAYMVRYWKNHAMLWGDALMILAIVISIFFFPFIDAPLGLLATTMTSILIGRHVYHAARRHV